MSAYIRRQLPTHVPRRSADIISFNALNTHDVSKHYGAPLVNDLICYIYMVQNEQCNGAV